MIGKEYFGIHSNRYILIYAMEIDNYKFVKGESILISFNIYILIYAMKIDNYKFQRYTKVLLSVATNEL